MAGRFPVLLRIGTNCKVLYAFIWSVSKQLVKVYGIWGDSYSSAPYNNNMLLYSMYNPLDNPISLPLDLSRTAFLESIASWLTMDQLALV